MPLYSYSCPHEHSASTAQYMFISCWKNLPPSPSGFGFCQRKQMPSALFCMQGCGCYLQLDGWMDDSKPPAGNDEDADPSHLAGSTCR